MSAVAEWFRWHAAVEFVDIEFVDIEFDDIKCLCTV
jgi:hypothetical protein